MLNYDIKLFCILEVKIRIFKQEKNVESDILTLQLTSIGINLTLRRWDMILMLEIENFLILQKSKNYLIKSPIHQEHKKLIICKLVEVSIW